MSRFAIGLLACAAAFGLAGPAAAAPPQCEIGRKIVFGDMDWESNRFHTAVARFILEHGYGCKTDAIPGSTIPILTALARGDVDVVMEIWKDQVTKPWTDAEAAGKVKSVGVNFPDAVQGWFVPRYVIAGDAKRGIKAAAPDLKRVADLPRYKSVFRDPEEPAKGRFYNCILGWNCEVVNTRKLAAYGLTKDYTNFRLGSGAALDAAIASAYERGKPILFYYWGPTWVMAKFDLVMLEEPAYNEKDWVALRAAKDPAQAKPVAYPTVAVYVGANAKFVGAAPNAVAFLARYRTTQKLVSAALLYLQEHKGAKARDAAVDFLRKKPDVWRAWVPADVYERVSAALK
ncbi:MAG: ABC transporter substrate-binding protein [Rhodospirillaceae bacterium]|nr:ABC transporter substrate-binding protein [Rhodospirillaceae bacterium]